ncbi:alanine racemase [Methylophaga sulfidovorans]|uniref:Alanine racemase n=1 Tax=Methylophaga sulfidovorans TaxID=45496 RepID=A0A1I3YG46_9GAMM|nr:alanine racemase [Methylophaga sulfidovorans]SFK30775.1 alanine racemase [Methylophaga sulfidovorans]
MTFPTATISVTALQYNFKRVKQTASNSKVMSVIKADAYGHGMATVAEALKHSDAFAVARLSEAVSLRQHGVTHPIVILEGINSADDFQLAAELRLSPVIHLSSQVDLLSSITLDQSLSFNWIMVDSGMHRLGIRPDDVETAISRLKASGNMLDEFGLMSHFANSDLVGDSRNQHQLEHMLNLKHKTGLPVCLSNSAAVLAYPESHLDWVRPGLMLYGISPFGGKAGTDHDLQPAMQLTTQLISTYDLNIGEQVGYGGDWTATQQSRIGVASIGYGDGYSRHLSNCSEVVIQGQRCPVIGRISMDTICINLTDCSQAMVGDEVLLWGRSELMVEEVAEYASTIPYELVTVLSKRVNRDVIDG